MEPNQNEKYEAFVKPMYDLEYQHQDSFMLLIIEASCPRELHLHLTYSSCYEEGEST